MILQRRNVPIQNDNSEIMDINIDGIKQKEPLQHWRKGIDLVEDRTDIVQQNKEHVIEIRYIPEKDKESAQDQTHADIEDHKTHHGEYQHQKMPAELNVIKQTEKEEYAQSQTEIDQA